LFDPINPNDKSFSKGRASLGRRANEIRNGRPPRLNDAITKPTHTPGVFNAIFMGEAELAVDIRADFVGIEHDCLQHRREKARHCCFASAGKAHYQNLAIRAGV
jgi:hypothetical protein